MYFIVYAHDSDSGRGMMRNTLAIIQFRSKYNNFIVKFENMLNSTIKNHPPYDLKVSPHEWVGCRRIFPYFSSNIFHSLIAHYALVIRTVFATIDHAIVLMHLMRYSVSFKSIAHGLRTHTHISLNQFHQKASCRLVCISQQTATQHETNQNNNIYQLKCELVNAVFCSNRWIWISIWIPKLNESKEENTKCHNVKNQVQNSNQLFLSSAFCDISRQQ